MYWYNNIYGKRKNIRFRAHAYLETIHNNRLHNRCISYAIMLLLRMTFCVYVKQDVRLYLRSAKRSATRWRCGHQTFVGHDRWVDTPRCLRAHPMASRPAKPAKHAGRRWELIRPPIINIIITQGHGET